MLQYFGDGMAQYRDEMMRPGQVQPFGAVNMTSVAEYRTRLWFEKLTLMMRLGHLKCESGGVCSNRIIVTQRDTASRFM